MIVRWAVPALLASLVALGCGGSSDMPIATATPGQLLVEESVDQALEASSFRVGSPLPAMSTTPFRVDSLPTFTAKTGAPSEGRQRLIPELRVAKEGGSGVVRVVSGEGRFARIIFDDTPTSRMSAARVRCGEWTAAHLSLQILDIRQDGRAVFTRVDGIFDGSACEAVERSRVSFEPAVLVPGYLFAFRTCTSSPCQNGRERVTFLMPPLAAAESDAGLIEQVPILTEPFGLVSFESVQGAAAVLTAVVNEAALATRFPKKPTWLRTTPVAVGIDLGRTTEEREPVGLASFGAVSGGPIPLPQATAGMSVE